MSSKTYILVSEFGPCLSIVGSFSTKEKLYEYMDKQKQFTKSAETVDDVWEDQYGQIVVHYEERELDNPNLPPILSDIPEERDPDKDDFDLENRQPDWQELKEKDE